MALTGLTKIQNVGISTTTIPTLGGSENTGVVTATNFVGDGSGLSGVTGSGSGVIVRDGGSLVGTAGTINFGTNLNVSAISAGIVTVSVPNLVGTAQTANSLAVGVAVTRSDTSGTADYAVVAGVATVIQTVGYKGVGSKLPMNQPPFILLKGPNLFIGQETFALTIQFGV